jgi:hypothetical protein
MPWNPSPNTVAQTGSQLLTPAAGLGTVTATGGSFTSYGPYPISGTGYEILFSAAVNSSGTSTNPFMYVELTWKDSVTGLILGTDNWICPISGTSGDFFPIYGRGPSKADTVTIGITNLDGVTGNFQVTLFQNSRAYITDDWKWINNQVIPAMTPTGYTLPSVTPDEGCLGSANITVPVSSTISRLFGMFNGPIWIGYDAGGPSATNQILTLTPQPQSVYNNSKLLVSPAAGPISGPAIGPRGPLQMTLQNLSAATAISANIIITAQPI